MLNTPAMKPDIVFDLTATGWTAVGSIVSAVSLIVLAVFNVIYLRRAHEQSTAALDQAKFAKATLETLQAQLLTQKKTEHLNAHAILARCAVELVQWRDRISIEQRSSGDEQIELIPPDWNTVATYISREFPNLHGTILNLGSKIKQLEGRVNNLVRIPVFQRAPNSSFGQSIQNTKENLDKLSFELNQIITQISR